MSRLLGYVPTNKSCESRLLPLQTTRLYSGVLFMNISDTIKDKEVRRHTDLEILTLLQQTIGNKHFKSFSATEGWLSPKALIELSSLAEYATPVQRIVIEDAATCILTKLLDYANNHVLTNFSLLLQQEPRSVVT
jgi:hypothetical protein